MVSSVTPIEMWPVLQLTTGLTTLRVSASALGEMLKRAVFTNIGVTAVTLTIYKVPSGGTAASSNAVRYTYSLAAGSDPLVPQELINMVLPQGASLQATASAAGAINTTGSGFSFA